MNYEQMNRVGEGKKVICIQNHWEFKEGDVGTIEFIYWAEGMKYRRINLPDGRHENLESWYQYWNVVI